MQYQKMMQSKYPLEEVACTLRKAQNYYVGSTQECEIRKYFNLPENESGQKELRESFFSTLTTEFCINTDIHGYSEGRKEEMTQFRTSEDTDLVL